MIKIITIIGARPQFIKSSAISNYLLQTNFCNEIIINTGQHFDDSMSKVFFTELNLNIPKYNLNINGLDHGAMTGRMLENIESILIIEKPDFVLVYGDTNSTLAGALAAKKLNIKIIHVEAGLRSYNTQMPEEINRIVTDRISDFLFCPTLKSFKNLESEGYKTFKVHFENVGDVMYDVFKNNIFKITNIDFKIPARYVLTTIHRAENTNFRDIFYFYINNLNQLSNHINILIPAHPRLLSFLKLYDIKLNNNIQLLPPVSYLEMLFLIKNSKMVITDSGGLQKDAFFSKKFCITLRNETEWVELVDQKLNYLYNINSNESLVEIFKKYVECHLDFDVNLYGNGDTANKIIHSIVNI